MNVPRGQTLPKAVVTIALTALLLAACSGGGSDARGPDTGTAEPGSLRTITAWAGSPDPGGAAYRDGTGSDARFEQPSAVATLPNGSVLVTEPDAERIRRIDAQGRVSTFLDVAAMAPRTDAAGRAVRFRRPHALATGPSGEVFAAVQQYTDLPDQLPAIDLRWAVLRLAPGPMMVVATLPMSEPEGAAHTVSGMAIDRLGRLHVGDLACTIWRTEGEVLSTSQPRSVVLVHASGVVRPGRGCSLELTTRGVTRLTLDADDRVLFTLARGEVRRIEPDGRITAMGQLPPGSAGFGCGGSMAVDQAGRLLLGGHSAALTRLDADGQEHVVAGSPRESGSIDGPAASARFGGVCGVAIDPEGRIVITDGGNNTLRRIDNDGSTRTLAGLAPQAGYRDGAGATARFHHLFSIGPGLGDEVVVADPNNRTVRRVDARQQVHTLVGVPEESIRYTGVDGPVASARLVAPTYALKTPDGSLWISDRRALRRLGRDGMVSTLPQQDSSSRSTEAVALDRSGDVVVARGGFRAGPGDRLLQHIDFERYAHRQPLAVPQRLETKVSGDLSTRLGQAPMLGLCVLQDGSFAYTQGQAVLRRTADGQVTPLAGSPDEAGDQDGAGAAARFRTPAGLACDAHGGLYVADSENHTVRYIDAQRQVRTVLGTLGRPGHRVDALPGELHTPRSLVLVDGGLVVGTGLGMVRAGF